MKIDVLITGTELTMSEKLTQTDISLIKTIYRPPEKISNVKTKNQFKTTVFSSHKHSLLEIKTQRDTLSRAILALIPAIQIR